MHQALGLAAQALCLSNPNPRVGCVLVNPLGQVIGQGHTQQAGGPHAEVMALRDAAARGQATAGATAYVTLEPCAHQGRTGPCCEALIQAGVAKVVAAITDPNPLVAGQGFARLRAAGIAVEIGPGAAAARELNLGFFSRMQRQRPWLRMKVAASLDGKTALPNGASQWITSSAARTDGHAWRARACAVLTGIGTLLADNPRLDVRLVDSPRQPARVLLDSRLQVPLDAHIFEAPGAVYIYAAEQNDAKQAALQALGATVVLLPDGRGQVDLPAMLRDLAARQVNELHVEAGARLNGALLQAGLVDELLVYLAPQLLGPGRPMAELAPLTALTEATALQFSDATLVGPDLRLLARHSGSDRF